MRKIFSFVLIFALTAGMSFGQEQDKKTSPGVSVWLRGLQSKIAQILPKKSVPLSTTGVAGVRGAKEDSVAKLYWKGKKGEEAVTEEEMAKFKACVDLAEKGSRDESLKQLEDFMKIYPDSALIPDAKKTIDLVKAEPREELKPELKAEEKAEKKQDEKTEKPADPSQEKKEVKLDEKK